eukprot:TRINITY_DN8412_c0_g1_i1.p2 TRINITY_DN8412_c0_g1~~TRINITY_DN8412_c0_g1_i1.p2  ORF type:complete len:166 (+),score=32.69 TRINITY_DN8412_c0_g1_i1:3-500(+)
MLALVRAPSSSASCARRVGAVRWSSKSSASGFTDFGAPIGGTRKLPISPHLQIYRFPLNAIASITTRITGVGAAIGATVLAVPMILNPATVAPGILALKAAVPAFVPFIKFIVAWPLVYHTLSGFRHWYWDFSSKGLDSLAQVDKSSRNLIFASILLAVYIAFLL